ncbi:MULTISPECIES: ABC transporter substrate-binding protein [Pseudanabaena]|jgi:NitT/TauT family transport system substrate-binding protein|uniref:ABC transporter substrate-binding protein n=1 Tax=Pseudanabaena TaxID=1152 RepID=UPI00247A462F|nr:MULTISPECIES: ABC transporter substrate-binding protein [Pseudanabaena]MEA5489998.1 ABC transporter substrate-binding protein [Pseudanabaena sp. CCNP1317]WGS73463.1 ABC transporter substrate-binding protein [Pseudanabaena galeata CCNP1313]
MLHTFQKQLNRILLIAVSTALLAACNSAPSTTGTTSGDKTAAPTTDSSPQASSTDKKEKQKIRVQLPFLKQSLDAPLIWAIEKGYFAEEGLDVSYERGFGNADTISKLGTGKYDIAFSDLYNAMEFNDKNPNDKILAVAFYQNKAPFSIITFKDKGINTPADLVGKKLGAPAGDGPRKLFPLFAKEVKISPDSVTWDTMEPKLRETFLLQGKVDAVSGFFTSVIPSLIKGGKTMDDLQIFFYSDFGLDFYGNGILVKQDFMTKNPEAIKSFLKAYFRGMQEVVKDPSAALDLVISTDQSKLMDRDAEKLRLKLALERMYVTPELEAAGFGGVDMKRLEKSITQTVEGFNLKPVTSADVFTDKFLPPKEQRMVPPASDRKPLL